MTYGTRLNTRVDPLIEALEHSSASLFDLIAALPDKDWRRQYHADLSPLGWHLGHCAFIQAYWVLEVVGQDDRLTGRWHDFYFPERSPKPLRSSKLPGKNELIGFITDLFDQSRQQLEQWMREGRAHPLLERGYLALFLMQHNHQHHETMQQVLLQRQLLERDTEAQPTDIIGRPPVLPTLRPEVTNFVMGCDRPEAYDNEQPVQSLDLSPFRIARKAVSNAEFLNFIDQGGYGLADCWGQEGWHWQQAMQIMAPSYWRDGGDGNWYAIGPRGPEMLVADEPVTGISYYEAEAYARFAGCRLPDEAEWECAAQQGLLEYGGAWEWCRRPFHPYPGFRPFPYDNYSQAWFDDSHYPLRGGSRHTHEYLMRPSFRNFYTPEKRHVFAGLRLARDDA